MPSRGDQPAEHRLPGGGRIDVKTLGVELAREVDDFVGGEAGRTEIVPGADLVVVPVARSVGMHGQRSSQSPALQARTSASRQGATPFLWPRRGPSVSLPP